MRDQPAPSAKAVAPAGSAAGSADDRLPGATRDSMPPGFPSEPAVGSRIRAYRLLWVIAIAVFLTDQASKFWIAKTIPFDPGHSHGAGTDVEVIRGFFYIIHV